MKNEQIIFNNLIENLNGELRRILSNIPVDYQGKIEEIRLRRGRPLMISYDGKDYLVSKGGEISSDMTKAFILADNHIQSSFQIISNYSPYAYLEEISRGYITIRGGHRVGIGGRVIYGNRGIENIGNISSLNIRIAREVLGVSNKLIPHLIDRTGYFINTLIISPPQCGKTTLLRDIIRNLSDGHYHKQGYKISVIDERSELAGMYNGLAQNQIGIRTDVLDACLKSDGIIMAIRSLSPDIIAVDEIGGERDIDAINEALRAGIRLIATIHGDDLREVRGKPSMRALFQDKIFGRYIILDRSKGVGSIRDILDGSGNSIGFKEV
ncbi:MAG: stage III sporulation protein AA [Tissierellaceae bacterium]